jgi:predicted porin
MKAIQKNKRRGKFHSALPISACVALSVAAGANAQSVLITPPKPPPEQTPAAEQTGETNQVEGATAPAGAPGKNTNPFQWGPLTFHPGISYGLTYATGLQSQPGQSQDSIIQTLSPSIGIDLGQHWRFGYTAAATFYSDSHFANTVDHSLSLSGNTAYQDWTFGLGQTVSISDDPQVATAQQTDQKTYVTSLGATYQMTSDLSCQLSAQQSILDVNGTTNSAYASGITGSRTWSTLDSLNYQLSPNLSTGIGAGFGYTDVDFGTDMLFEQVQGQIGWHFSRKLFASANVGYQFDQFVNSDQPDLNAPTFGLGLTYTPFEATVITLSASRTVSASSYFVNQVTESTGFNASISQRLFRHFNLGLAGGYANTSYRASVKTLGTLINREDNVSFFSVSLSTAFLKRGTASISYSRSENSSNQGGFGFTSDQIGFSLAYSY